VVITPYLNLAKRPSKIQHSAMPETLTLTNGQLAKLAAGHAALDGIRVKPDEFRAYRFKDDEEAEFTWLIANNSAVIADSLKAFDRAKKLLALQHGVADSMPVNSETAPRIVAFTEALAALEEKTVAVPLSKLKRDSLNVTKNGIPPSVLTALMPVLE
jgi:hypothetical protein